MTIEIPKPLAIKKESDYVHLNRWLEKLFLAFQQLKDDVSEIPTYHNKMFGMQGGQVTSSGTDERYHLTLSEYTELTEWIDSVILGSSGALTTSDAITAGEFISNNYRNAGSTSSITWIPASNRWELDSLEATGVIYANNYSSDIATGTSPYACTSETLNTHLNADLLDGYHKGTSGDTYPLLSGVNTWSGNQTFATTTQLFFRDSGIHLNSSSDGYLDIAADGRINITTPYIVTAQDTLLAAILKGEYRTLTFYSSPSGQQSGIYLDFTTAGSTAGIAGRQTGIQIAMESGYTGSAAMFGLQSVVNSASTGNNFDTWAGNFGFNQYVHGTTTGLNCGGNGYITGGNYNVGFCGAAPGAKNSATNIGMMGLAINTGTSPVQIGGYFATRATNGFTYPTISGALICDNGTQTSDIFRALDNGTLCQSIPDGGNFLSSTTYKHNFRDTAIGIYSQADTFLDIFADGGVRMGDSSAGAPTNYTKFDSDGTISFTGTSGIVLPHLMQSDNTDQSIADVTDEQIITFDTDVHHNLITRTSSSRFTITKAGSYLVTFSAVALSGVAGKKIAIWMKKNGTNVDDSSTYYTFKSANANTIITVNFLYHFAVNDYFEFFMWGDDTGIKLDTIAAVAASEGVTPAIPACPSIILTCNYIGKD